MPDTPCRACRIIHNWSRQRDQWGHYSICTGHERPGRCFWCGAEVRNRRYCLPPPEWGSTRGSAPFNSPCEREYARHFFWPYAAAWCWERAEGKCRECGTYTPPELRRTHHIIPLNGAKRGCNVLNRPENLMPLCAHHHGLIHGPAIGAAARRANEELRRRRALWLAG